VWLGQKSQNWACPPGVSLCPLWGVTCLYEGYRLLILNEIWAQVKMYILVDTFLG
jgi:hypothetical protein